MGKVHSVYKAIEGVELNKNYSACISHFMEIREHSGGYVDALFDSFKFGYLQGMKAAKAEMKKGGAVNGNKSR